MGDLSDIKKRLKRQREVKIDFWDGMRDYQGVALNITTATLQGYLKMVVKGDETFMPSSGVALTFHSPTRYLTFSSASLAVLGFLSWGAAARRTPRASIAGIVLIIC